MYKGVFKEHHGIMHKLSMNRQWAASSVAEGTISAINDTYQSAESFWNEDGTGYQHAGNVISSLGKMGLNVTAAVAFGFATHGGSLRSANSYRRAFSKMADSAMGLVGKGEKYSEIEALSLNGKIFSEMHPGRFINIFDHIGHGQLGDTIGMKAMTEEELLSAGAKSGVWRFATKAGEASGYFIKGSRLMSFLGGGLAVAGVVLGSMALEKSASLAGRLMDEAHIAYTQSKYHSYDLREFNNRSAQQWGFNKQNQAAANLMPFEQNNVSLARLYYSR
jgi:hypothetical protein